MKKLTDLEILNGVLREFKKLANIPRPSKHEKKISDFLKTFFIENKFEVVQDDFNNIIAEIPADMKSLQAPLTILQAHMDMVCVSEKNKNFDPLNDPIKLIQNEAFLEADATSLGADNGIGVAELLFIAKNLKFNHGSLRIIFTTDEEEGMSGALNLHKNFLEDAKFLINCDSEDLIVSSAGNVHATLWLKPHYVDFSERFTTSVKIKIFGLRGGHSGGEISSGRINAIKLAIEIVQQISRLGKVRLANFDGGQAFNAIPSNAEMIIVTRVNLEDIENICKNTEQILRKVYESTDPNITITAEKIQSPAKILHEKDHDNLVNLLSIIHSGVYQTSPENSLQVLSSANVGIINLNDEKIEVKILARSNSDYQIRNFIEMFRSSAKSCGFFSEFSELIPAWEFNPNSKLLEMCKEILLEQNDYKPKISKIHSGLETSLFHKKNSMLDIISTGTRIEGAHSVKEKLYLNSVVPHVKFLIALLEKIAGIKS